MTAEQFILAIDQGTTSSRALLFDRSGAVVSLAQRAIDVTYPHPGWVNQDANQIWSVTEAVCREALAQADAGWSQVAAIGMVE